MENTSNYLRRADHDSHSGPSPLDMETHLAPYAARSALSRGRRHSEPPPLARTEFQRDRDRIIHSTAFRRLEYKTQVFIIHEGEPGSDLFRTRLTHTLEVAQIARSVARNLRVNEDLVEAISLAHDLGHTPFGHAGQEALHSCMREYGGFEHNLQSLTIVDELEQHYGSFNGLNLCFETREGILKHCSRENASQLGELGKRFLDGGQPLIEAQIANLADEIAYNNHDIDDGLRSGLLTFEQLAEVELWRTHHESVLAAHPTLANSIRGPHSEGERLIHETTRRIINTLIVDLIDTTRATLRQHAPNSPDEVRRCPPLVGYSSEIAEQATQLKRFLFKNLYRHYRVMRMTNKACHVIRSLFDAFSNDNRLLPPAYRATDTTAQTAAQTTTQMRLIAHYIASMTDRYAYQEYRRLFVIGGE